MQIPGLRVFQERYIMNEQTCAACDYKLDDSRILVNIGGKAVEVCCEDCAEKLREAVKSAKAAQPGPERL